MAATPRERGAPGTPPRHTLALPAWRGASRQPAAAHAAAGYPLGAEVLSCSAAALGLREPFGVGGGARGPRRAVPAGGRERALQLSDCGGGAALRAAPARGFYLASPAAPATAALENF